MHDLRRESSSIDNRTTTILVTCGSGVELVPRLGSIQRGRLALPLVSLFHIMTTAGHRIGAEACSRRTIAVTFLYLIALLFSNVGRRAKTNCHLSDPLVHHACGGRPPQANGELRSSRNLTRVGHESVCRDGDAIKVNNRPSTNHDRITVYTNDYITTSIPMDARQLHSVRCPYTFITGQLSGNYHKGLSPPPASESPESKMNERGTQMGKTPREYRREAALPKNGRACRRKSIKGEATKLPRVIGVVEADTRSPVPVGARGIMVHSYVNIQYAVHKDWAGRSSNGEVCDGIAVQCTAGGAAKNSSSNRPTNENDTPTAIGKRSNNCCPPRRRALHSPRRRDTSAPGCFEPLPARKLLYMQWHNDTRSSFAHSLCDAGVHVGAMPANRYGVATAATGTYTFHGDLTDIEAKRVELYSLLGPSKGVALHRVVRSHLGSAGVIAASQPRVSRPWGVHTPRASIMGKEWAAWGREAYGTVRMHLSGVSEWFSNNNRLGHQQEANPPLRVVVSVNAWNFSFRVFFGLGLQEELGLSLVEYGRDCRWRIAGTETRTRNAKRERVV
ncbi:hypothetical protein EDB87DRAFT_1582057 [Lactarius vividus]|nr:hypothetical protein EDB87DRAFT_1582057 [Lactarius vividus]